MNVLAFLILWSSPCFLNGGDGLSLHGADLLRLDARGVSLFQRPTGSRSSADDPGVASPGASTEEEEDSLEDVSTDSGLIPSPSARGLDRGDRSALVRTRHDSLPAPSRSRPLRC